MFQCTLPCLIVLYYTFQCTLRNVANQGTPLCDLVRHYLVCPTACYFLNWYSTTYSTLLNMLVFQCTIFVMPCEHYTTQCTLHFVNQYCITQSTLPNMLVFQCTLLCEFALYYCTLYAHYVIYCAHYPVYQYLQYTIQYTHYIIMVLFNANTFVNITIPCAFFLLV